MRHALDVVRKTSDEADNLDYPVRRDDAALARLEALLDVVLGLTIDSASFVSDSDKTIGRIFRPPLSRTPWSTSSRAANKRSWASP